MIEFVDIDIYAMNNGIISHEVKHNFKNSALSGKYLRCKIPSKPIFIRSGLIKLYPFYTLDIPMELNCDNTHVFYRHDYKIIDTLINSPEVSGRFAVWVFGRLDV